MGFLRLAFFVFLFFLLYRFLKALFSPLGKGEDTVTLLDKKPEEDEMIKDPYCETYITKRGSIPLKINGKRLYFCSKECLERYKIEKIRIKDV